MNLRIKCQTCAVRMQALCSSVSERAAVDLGRSFHRRHVPQGQAIHGGGQRSHGFAIIVSGVVKLSLSRPDGRNQIVGLQFPSQFVGRPFAETPALMAEAATNLDLCCFQGQHFESLMKEHPDIEHVLFKRTLDDLDAAREWMFMISRKTAEERLASLLLLIARRMGEGERTLLVSGMNAPAVKTEDKTGGKDAGGAQSEFELPLSRTEIAECLGLRLETVSRQFAQLKAQGIIETERQRRLRIRDLAALERLCEERVEPI